MDDFDIAMEDALDASWLRPGITHVLKTCDYYRRKNLIKKICLYTNSTNEYNWVSYLVKCLEGVLEINNIFDLVIARESSGRTQVPISDFTKYGGCQPKFVDDVIRLTSSPEDTPVLFYDDRTFNIVPSKNGKSIFHTVSPYLKNSYYYEDHELFIGFIEDNLPDYLEYFEDKLHSCPQICGFESQIEKLNESETGIKTVPDRLINLVFARQTVTEFLSPLIANIIRLVDSSENQTESHQSLQNQVTEHIDAHLRLLL